VGYEIANILIQTQFKFRKAWFSKMAKQRKQNFLQGAFILGAGTLIVKIIGAIFKIPLTTMITAEGIGYFNTAYQLYMPIYTLAMAGLPIAIARMVAESVAKNRYREVRQIKRVATRVFLITGAVGCLIMLLGARPYTVFTGNPHSIWGIYIIAPSVFFCCMMASFRGYYEGLRNMYPTMVSQVIEALSKLILGLLFANLVLQIGIGQYQDAGAVFGQTVGSMEAAISAAYPFAAAAAIGGVSIGSILGAAFLFLRYRIAGDGITERELDASVPARSAKAVFKSLLKIAIPIAIGALVLNLTTFIDSTFLQNSVKMIVRDNVGSLREVYGNLIPTEFYETAGVKIPNYLFGCYTYALTIYMLVPTLTQAFGISALPAVTTAWAMGDKEETKKNVETVLRLTGLIALPAGLGMTVLAHPILTLLFVPRSDDIAVVTKAMNEVAIAAPLLSMLGIAVIFVALSTPVNSMLQAVGRVDLPVKLLAIGAVIKIAINYTLVRIPSINIKGAPIGTIVCYLFVVGLSLYFLCREVGFVPNFYKALVKPLFAALLCAAAAWASFGLLCKLLPEKIATVGAIGAGGAVYIAAIFLLGAVSKEDLKMLKQKSKK